MISIRALATRDLDVPNPMIADQKYESFEEHIRLENCEQKHLKIIPLDDKPWIPKKLNKMIIFWSLGKLDRGILDVPDPSIG